MITRMHHKNVISGQLNVVSLLNKDEKKCSGKKRNKLKKNIIWCIQMQTIYLLSFIQKY